MLSSQVKFSADRLTDRPTDVQSDRRTPVKQYAPRSIDAGSIKMITYSLHVIAVRLYRYFVSYIKYFRPYQILLTEY